MEIAVARSKGDRPCEMNSVSLPVAILFLAVVVAMVGAFLLPSFFTFDALVRREHDRYLDAWERDGRPDGFFWRPDGASSFFRRFRSGWAMNRCTLVWLFWTPKWIVADAEVMRLLRRLRWLVLAWNIGALGAFAVALVRFL